MNFKSISLFFLCLLLVLICINLYISIGFWVYLFLVILYIGIIAYGAASIRSNFFIKSICSIETEEKAIAITFDDGPTENTALILDVLKSYNIKATFFCIGEQIEKNSDIFKRIDAEGHLIGNHSYSHHLWFDFFSANRMMAEFQKTDSIIEKLISKKIKFFRPPYGVTNPTLKKAVIKMNYTTIGWSLKSFDTVKKDKQDLLLGLKKKLKKGDIVLFHDNQKITSEVLKDFLDFALQNNFKIHALDKLLNIQAYANNY